MINDNHQNKRNNKYENDDRPTTSNSTAITSNRKTNSNYRPSDDNNIN